MLKKLALPVLMLSMLAAPTLHADDYERGYIEEKAVMIARLSSAFEALTSIMAACETLCRLKHKEFHTKHAPLLALVFLANATLHGTVAATEFSYGDSSQSSWKWFAALIATANIGSYITKKFVPQYAIPCTLDVPAVANRYKELLSEYKRVQQAQLTTAIATTLFAFYFCHYTCV